MWPLTVNRDAFARREAVGFRTGLQARNERAVMAANEDGSGERQLAVRKLPNCFECVAWSPNGKTIATATFNSEAG